MEKTISQRLCERMMECVDKDEIVERVIPFRNNDVPEFLVRLEEFERKSRETNLSVKSETDFRYSYLIHPY